MDRQRFEELKAAYALGALPEQERAELQEYLASHPEAAREVDEMESAARLLALSPEEQEPSPEVRHNLLEQIGDHSAPQPAPSRVRSLSTPRRALAAAAAALIVLSIGFNVFQYSELQDLRDVQPEIATVEGEGGDAHLISWDGENAVLVASAMPELPQDRTYEIWTIKDGDPQPAGTFDAGGAQTVAVVEGSLEGAQTVAVTVEPAGGSEKPTTEPIMATRLDAASTG